MKNLKRITMLSLLALAGISQMGYARIVDVYSGTELQDAIKAALPGDEIVLNPAAYSDTNPSKSGDPEAYYYLGNSGTAANPITIRSKSRTDMQTLYGTRTNEGIGSKIVMRITGDYWIVKDIRFHTAKKGIFLENANNNVLDNIEVFNSGNEAIHIRENSSNNVVKNCWVHDTGNLPDRQGYGEAIYVGTHNGLSDNSNNNRIGGCKIGPGVTSEGFDIKEGTVGTIVEYNQFDGSGTAGAEYNFSDSFIDIKGDQVIVRNNTFDDKNNLKITRGIHVNRAEENRNSWIYDNTIKLNTSAMFVRNESGAVHMRNNSRSNSGDLYTVEFGATVDDVIPSNLPAKGTYTGFGGSVTSVGSSSAAASSTPASTPASSRPASSSSSSSSSVASGGCISYTGGRTELNLTSTQCVDLNVNLSGKTLALWDSDAVNCDFKGSVVSVNGSGSLAINSTYQKSTTMTGTRIKFNSTGTCNYIKMYVY